MSTADANKEPAEPPEYFEEATWYISASEFTGYGKAIFEEPAGTIEGPVSFSFDDLGEPNATLNIERFNTDIDLPLGLFQFFYRDVVTKDENSISQSITLDTVSNRCISFEAEFQEGRFGSDRVFSASLSGVLLPDLQKGTTIRFRFFGGQFIHANANKGRPPKYWAMPLINFVAWYPTGISTLKDHPLRLRKALDAPESLDDLHRNIFALNSHNAHPLIEFSFDGHQGFIEPMLEYQELADQLKSRQRQRAVTGIMVGELPASANSHEKLEKLLPRDIQVLLGAATGSEVGSPWIELRDADGELVSRTFAKRNNPYYARGHCALAGVANAGIGKLLTKGFSSDGFDTSQFRFIGTNLIRSGLYNQSLDDSLALLFRAYDSLCNSMSISSRSSVEDILKEHDRDKIRKILRDASKQIRDLADSLSDEEAVAKTALARTAQKVSEAKFYEVGFGRSLRELILKFGFCDLSVVDSYMLAHTMSGKSRWEDFVPFCRGVIMHSGYIDPDEFPTLLTEASALRMHLHDLLLRIFLTLAGYDGTYQPTPATLTGEWELSWVEPDTLPKRLGYH